MKTIRSFFGGVTLLLFINIHNTFSQEEVAVSDFRYPETQALDWKGGLSGSFSSSNSKQSYPAVSTADGVSGYLGISTSGLYFHSKENHDNLMTFQGSFNYLRANREAENASYPEERKRDFRGSINGDWNYGHYFADNDGLHFVGEGSLRYNGSVYKTNEVLDSGRTSAERVHTAYDLALTGFLGIGYGRMRDGTFVIRALRIVERLGEDGALSHSLTRSQMLAVIDRLAHRREYVTNFERHEKYFVADIVAELVAEGVIDQEAITPFAAVKMTEVLKEEIEPRFFGWKVSYVVGGMHHQEYDDSRREHSDGYVVTSHSFQRDFVLRHRVAGEFGHAVSLWTHIDGKASFEIPQRSGSKFFSIDAQVNASHQVGERIDLVGTYRFSRFAGSGVFFPPESNYTDTYYWRAISHELRATLRFFLEDRVSFYSNAYYQHALYDFYDATPLPSNDNSRRRQSGVGVAFGVQYNII